MAGEWQPIDTAPTDATTVLLWDGIAVMVGYYVGPCDEHLYEWAIFNNIVGHQRPTHWMPLPEPPQ